MTPQQFRALLDHTAKKLAASNPANRPDLLSGTFPEQRAFLEDKSRFKAAHCSRGAAKSYTAGLGIFNAMQNFPGCSCFYATKTHDTARNIMWRTVMKDIDQNFKLGVEFNETLLEGRHPNGSTFRLIGIDGDRKQQDKLLGGKYKLVVLDEVAFFETDLTEIIYKTIIPATGRIGGAVWMMSTSSDYPRGLFFEATRPERELRTKGWSVHEWQWWDNPYVRDEMQKTVEELVAANPLIVETNHFKQHYLNEWVIDENKLVYRYSAERNLISVADWEKLRHQLHPEHWARVLGGDTGWEDDNALVLTSYHLNDPRLFVPTSWSEKKLTFDQFADKISTGFMHKPNPPQRVVIDGANKQGVESMRVRSGIPFEYADKLDKATFIELMNADLVSGVIKIVDVPENKALIKEMAELVWVTDGDKIKYPKKEHPGLPNHRCFIAGTVVRVPGGYRPIESLKGGDWVETRKGPRRIQNAIQDFSPVIQLTLSNGTKVVCTPDHPFWSADKWIPAKDLKTFHPLLTWEEHRQERCAFRGTGIYTDEMADDTFAGKMLQRSHPVSTSIDLSGNGPLVRFRQGITSIIAMVTKAIIALKTWNAYRAQHIALAIQIQVNRNSFTDTAIWLPHGIAPRKDENGTGSMAIKPSALSQPHALGVMKRIKSHICTRIKMAAVRVSALRQSVALLASMMKNAVVHGAMPNSLPINIASKEPAHLHVRSITALSCVQKVFNLTVEDVHEYFAEGILVSNCDAFLYAWRLGFHYHHAPAKKKVVKGSAEWYQLQSHVDWEGERKRLMEQQNQGDWPDQPANW